MNDAEQTLNNKLIVNLSHLLLKSTGISNYTKNLFPQLKTLEPTLLSSEIYPEFDCYHIPNNLSPAQGTKGHFNRIVWTQFQLPKIYKKLKAKILFSPIPEAPIWTECRNLVVVHDFIPLRFPKQFSPLTYYHRYYVPQVLNQSEHIICNSQSTAKDISSFCNIPTNKITPILLAYDSNHFYSVIEEKSNPFSPYPYFLYIGRHDPHKNVSRVISAFAKLKSHHEYQLLLAGSSDDRYTPELKKQVQELGVTHQVKFLEYVPYDDLPKIISGAIALVFPSLWEGFGLPVLEAMACGTPVITSNLSSLPEVAGDAAILIDPYKVEEITDAMQAISNDSGLRSKLSLLGLARASQFSWEKTGKATVEVLKQFM
ncbi:glycosyltransferase family 4 protein [Pseudanabaena sp. UWO311]|uniref:glycosyltransferase family 4 protein n=1 Tax=Pseudanabaena sp. UWO311 TaxID=2487337 RepID=UPI001159324A|nr:glycosyltransferase family 1 protein [Pseudanabaena sp. UWO311]TYQ26988.1 glycosyltransferase family 4 protein [Pseudanabaena sp. UWO311]